MTRVYIICEGQTEETFINEVLAPIFLRHEIYLLPRLIGKLGHQGGNVKYQRVLRDIKMFLLDQNAYCSTFFDFYGLDEKFPGKQEAILAGGNSASKQNIFHSKFMEQLALDINPLLLQRFIPYVQMYEFEGLLFSSPDKLANNLNMEVTPFYEICQQFTNPEDINNSQSTAPSKRIISLCPSYDKVIQGNIVALEIGLDQIMTSCQLFVAWVNKLKQLQ